jgi:hypothetical protein
VQNDGASCGAAAGEGEQGKQDAKADEEDERVKSQIYGRRAVKKGGA